MTLFKKESTVFRQHFFAKTHTWCVANFANLAEFLFAKRARRPALVLFFQQRNESSDIDREEPILTYAPLVVNQEANRPHESSTKRQHTWNITVNAAEIQEISTYRAATGEILPWKLAMWGCFRDGKLLEKVTRQFSIFRDFSKAHGLIAHQGFELREIRHSRGNNLRQSQNWKERNGNNLRQNQNWKAKNGSILQNCGSVDGCLCFPKMLLRPFLGS